jgi:uncharacterized protein
LVRKPNYALIFLSLLCTPLFFAPPSNAQFIEADWIDSIENYAYEVDLNTTAEIVVCVFPSLYGHGIKDSSVQEINDIVKLGVHVFNDESLDVLDGTQTGIGKAGKDNGVLVIVALEEQQWRIEVGYGLEGDITDIETNLIAQEYLVPALKQGYLGEGLYYTVVALGEQIPPSDQTASYVRGYYYYESDTTAPDSTPFWLYNIYGLPLWLIILLAILGVGVPVFGGRARRGGGRSGGGGSSGRW